MANLIDAYVNRQNSQLRLKTLLASPEYQALDPAGRKELHQIYRGLSEAEQEELIQELTPVDTPDADRQLTGVDPKGMGQAAASREQNIGSAKQLAAGAVNYAAGAGIPAAILKPGAGHLATTGAEVLGNLFGSKLNKTLGLEQGSPEGWDTGDTISTAIPLAMGAGRAALRYLNKPARERLQMADDANAKRQTEYQQKVTNADFDTQEKIARAEDAVDARNQATNVEWAKKQQAWADEPAKINREYFQKIGDIQRNNTLDRAEQAAEIQRLNAERQARIATHHQAGQDIRGGAATASIPNIDSAPAYAASRQAAAQAPDVDVAPLRAAADRAGLGLGTPVTADNPAAGVAARMSRWGQVTTPGQPASSIAGPSGAPLQGATGPTVSNEPVPLQEVLETIQDLGQALGQATGQQRARLRDMYREGQRFLDQVSSQDTNAQEAITQFREGQRLWGRNQTLQTVQRVMDTNTTGSQTAGYAVKAEPIQTRIERLRNPDLNHWADTLTPAEWDNIETYVAGLPREPVGAVPRQRPAPTPNRAIDEATIQRDRALDAHSQTQAPARPAPETLDYDDFKANYPEVPEKVDPRAIDFPFGKFILARILSGNAGAAALGQQGSNNLLSWVGGLLAIAPEIVSGRILNSEKGIRMARKIMANPELTGTKRRAALTALAKGLTREDEETQ